MACVIIVKIVTWGNLGVSIQARLGLTLWDKEGLSAPFFGSIFLVLFDIKRAFLHCDDVRRHTLPSSLYMHSGQRDSGQRDGLSRGPMRKCREAACN